MSEMKVTLMKGLLRSLNRSILPTIMRVITIKIVNFHHFFWVVISQFSDTSLKGNFVDICISL